MQQEPSLSRRALLAAAGGLAATGVAAGDDSVDGGTMTLNQAYNVSGDLWQGPDSAKSNVDPDEGRLYVAVDTQVEYYGDGSAWTKLGVGSQAEPVPEVTSQSVSTDKQLINHTLPPLSEIGDDPQRASDALEMLASGPRWTDASYETVDSSTFVNKACASSVYTQTGETVFLPYFEDRIYVYDHVTESVVGSDTHDQTGDSFWMGAAAVKTGEVIMMPHKADVIGRYDLPTHTYSGGPTHGEGDTAFVGAIYPRDNLVIGVPRDSPNVGRYYVDSATYESGASHGKGTLPNGAYQGGCPMLDGNCLFAPTDAANLGIYDPDSDTLTDGPAHGEGSFAFVDVVPVPGDRYVLVPYHADNVLIYERASNSLTTVGPHGQGDKAFVGGGLGMDYRVYLFPEEASNVGIVDLADDSYIDGPAHNSGVTKTHLGGSLQPNGDFVMPPHDGDSVGVIRTGAQMPKRAHQTCLHPLINGGI